MVTLIDFGMGGILAGVVRQGNPRAAACHRHLSDANTNRFIKARWKEVDEWNMTMPADIMESLRQSVAAAAAAGDEHRDEGRQAVGTTVTVTVAPVDAYSSMSTLKM